MPGRPTSLSGPARLAFVLAGVSGFVDSVGFLTASGTFVSFMSGNTTATGLALGRGAVGHALLAGLPIPLYVLGTAAGSLLLTGRGAGRPAVYALCSALLVGFVVLRSLTPDPAPPTATVTPTEALALVLLVLPMGALNATLRRVRVRGAGEAPVGLGYITGTLTALGEHLAGVLARRGGGRVTLLYAGLWGSFLAGATLGAWGTARYASWALVLPAGVLFALSLLPTAGRTDAPADL